MSDIKEDIVSDNYTEEEIKAWKEDKSTKKIFDFLSKLEEYYFETIARFSVNITDGRDIGRIANISGRICLIRLLKELDLSTIESYFFDFQHRQLEPTELL
jgi:hypothetical protein